MQGANLLAQEECLLLQGGELLRIQKDDLPFQEEDLQEEEDLPRYGQEESLPLVQEENRLLGQDEYLLRQEEDLLLVHEEGRLLVKEEDLVLVQGEDLLLVQ